MYICPNCGDDLKFSIEEQKLCCPSCHSAFDPESQLFASRPEENELEVTVFTCPQCGAEMYSSDTDATAFCSYCGASNVLESRLAGISRPARIIPFRKTKEDCRKAFERVTRKALFAPAIYRDAEYLDNYRPIYMPYWLYSMDIKGRFSITGKKEHREGNYEITERSSLSCDMDAVYHDIPFDASSAFDDRMGREIAPFLTKEAREFSSTWLAGVYANVADVESSVYENEAVMLAANDAVSKIEDIKEFDGFDYDLSDDVKLPSKFPIKNKRTEAAMLPVWFLSFRNGDRVAYAAVNGQTGKVSCELPVSIPRFFAFSLALAVPLFFLFNLFLTLRPSTELRIAAIGAMLMALLYALSAQQIRDRDEHLLDKGYMRRSTAAEVRTPGRTEEPNPAPLKAAGKKGRSAKKGIKIKEAKVKEGEILLAFGFAAAAGLILDAILCVILFTMDIYPSFITYLPFTFLAVVFAFVKLIYDVPFELPGRLLLIVSLAAVAVILLNPVSDLIFYGTAVLILGVMVYALFMFLLQYNRIVTRPIPQFGKRPDDGMAVGTGGNAGSGNAGGRGNAGGSREGSGRKGGRGISGLRAVSGVLICLLLVLQLSAVSVWGGKSGKPEELRLNEGILEYYDEDTGYTAYIQDEADILTDGEEEDLISEIMPLTEWGNAVFASGYSVDGQSTYDLAGDLYESWFGSDSGTLFMVDMAKRQIYLYSDGRNRRTVTDSYAYVITDNVYRYASRGDYYGCASEAFSQVGRLLKGQRIAQPMKYINNVLLALLTALLLNYVILRAATASKAPSDSKVLDSIVYAAAVSAPSVVFKGRSKRYAPKSSSGGGGGGGRSGGGGGGGGGHSGGGGGHGF